MTKTPITITFTGGDFIEVQQTVLAFAAHIGGDKIASVSEAVNAPEAKVELTPAAEPEPATEPEPEAPAADPEPEGVVKDMSASEARDAAIKEVQAHYVENPNNMVEISKLQKKYGVKMFTEVSDAKAHDFLADVRLMTAGAAAA